MNEMTAKEIAGKVMEVRVWESVEILKAIGIAFIGVLLVYGFLHGLVKWAERYWERTKK